MYVGRIVLVHTTVNGQRASRPGIITAMNPDGSATVAVIPVDHDLANVAPGLNPYGDDPSAAADGRTVFSGV